jgi:hypothetical protein
MWLNYYFRSIKLRQIKSTEWLVVAGPLFRENTDRDLLTEFYRFGCIGTPMNTSSVATEGHVCSDLIEFTTNRELISIRTRVRSQAESIVTRLQWCETDIDESG